VLEGSLCHVVPWGRHVGCQEEGAREAHPAVRGETETAGRPADVAAKAAPADADHRPVWADVDGNERGWHHHCWEAEATARAGRDWGRAPGGKGCCSWGAGGAAGGGGRAVAAAHPGWSSAAGTRSQGTANRERRIFVPAVFF
jgi:hypothetical protein